MAHIFISYKSQEHPYAAALRDHLNEWGYDTWLDVDNLPTSTQREDDYKWQTQIDSALKSAKAVIAIMTPLAVASRYVTSEWDIALVHCIPFIPLIAQPTTLPTKYDALHLVDASSSFVASDFTALHSLLEKALSITPQAKADAYADYLVKLFDRISVELGRLMIKTLTTYGSAGAESGEPIRLTTEVSFGKNEEALQTREFLNFDLALEACEWQSLVIGEAGGGKTITLLNSVRDAVVRRALNQDFALPIFARINTWGSQKQRSDFTAWLVQESDAPASAKFIIEQRKALLLLDGLDELAQEHRNAQTGEITYPRQTFLSLLSPQHHLVMTCRADTYADVRSLLPFRNVIRLLPLSEQQTRDYLRDQPEVLAALHADTDLAGLLKTPMLLSYFAFSYERMNADERRQFMTLRDEGSIRDRVFQFYVEKRYQHEASRDTLPFSQSDLLNRLGRLASHIALGSYDTAYQEDILEIMGYDESLIDPFITLIVKLNLFLAQESAGRRQLRFVHRLLGEFLVMSYCLPRLNDTEGYKRFPSPAESLAQISDRRAVEPLLAALKNPEPKIRRGVVKAMGGLRDGRIIPALIDVLDDPSPNVRYYAIQALELFNNSLVVNALIRKLADDELVYEWGYSQGTVAQNAAKALKRLHTAESDTAVEAWRRVQCHEWIAALNNPDVEVRSSAVLDLQTWGDESTVMPLIRLLADMEADVFGIPLAYRAADTLGHLRAKQSVPHLIKLLSITNDEFRASAPDEVSINYNPAYTAATALERIGTELALAAVKEWRAKNR